MLKDRETAMRSAVSWRLGSVWTHKAFTVFHWPKEATGPEAGSVKSPCEGRGCKKRWRFRTTFTSVHYSYACWELSPGSSSRERGKVNQRKKKPLRPVEKTAAGCCWFVISLRGMKNHASSTGWGQSGISFLTPFITRADSWSISFSTSMFYPRHLVYGLLPGKEGGGVGSARVLPMLS